ncbi:MAG: ribonuclease III, partial [Pseudomonadota bacterium]|nr:ribonuclease III [Pseudomonadota bacterium]
LELALTHSSGHGANQQRLEFLGDAVLGAAASASLFREHPDWSEGDMSVARTRMVCQDSLAACARQVALPELLRVSAAVARSGAVHERASVLADTIEALIGAVFVDGGYAAAEAATLQLLGPLLAEAGVIPEKDAKTRLQEWLHRRGWPLPTYRLLATEGPANALVFRAECSAGRPPRLAQGEGRSRRSAEQAAAAQVLAGLLGERERQTADGVRTDAGDGA